jgi:hypothetical protein
LLLIDVSLCEVLGLVVSFPTSPSSLKMDFICISFCVFGFGGFTGSFLWEVLTSLYLIFYLLSILGLYVVHWIGLSLSFSKSPSLLKTESGRKSYDRFHLLRFSVGANPVSTGIFTGRPVSGQRHRAVHREAGFWPAALGCTPAGPALVPGLHRKPVQNMISAQVRRLPGCAPGGPAQSPARPTFDRFLLEICPQRPYFDLL